MNDNDNDNAFLLLQHSKIFAYLIFLKPCYRPNPHTYHMCVTETVKASEERSCGDAAQLRTVAPQKIFEDYDESLA